MRRSLRVTLTVVSGVALISCGRRALDPCANQTFNAQACQDAVRSGGYFWNGTWYPMKYTHPYPFYYDSYQSYHGPSSGASAASYAQPSGVERGGFGSTGEAHGASGGEGVGE
jgi:hypothetical protein